MLSIDRILPRARGLYPDRPAVNGGDGWLTFEQIGKRVDALSGALAGLGMRPGDRVAVLDFNSARYLEAYYAAAQAGFVMVPLNSRLAAPEVEYILKDCTAKVLIASPPLFPSGGGASGPDSKPRGGRDVRSRPRQVVRLRSVY